MFPLLLLFHPSPPPTGSPCPLQKTCFWCFLSGTGPNSLIVTLESTVYSSVLLSTIQMLLLGGGGGDGEKPLSDPASRPTADRSLILNYYQIGPVFHCIKMAILTLANFINPISAVAPCFLPDTSTVFTRTPFWLALMYCIYLTAHSLLGAFIIFHVEMFGWNIKRQSFHSKKKIFDDWCNILHYNFVDGSSQKQKGERESQDKWSAKLCQLNQLHLCQVWEIYKLCFPHLSTRPVLWTSGDDSNSRVDWQP